MFWYLVGLVGLVLFCLLFGWFWLFGFVTIGFWFLVLVRGVCVVLVVWVCFMFCIGLMVVGFSV